VSAEDELAKDRDVLQTRLAIAERKLAEVFADVPDVDKLRLRVEELEVTNSALKESLQRSAGMQAAIVVGENGQPVVTQQSYGELLAERDRLAETLARSSASPPMAASKSAAAKLFDKLSPAAPSRESVLTSQLKAAEQVLFLVCYFGRGYILGD